MTISTPEKKSRARTLAALVEARLPADFDVHGDEDAWSCVAIGLLARRAGTMLSLVDLEPSGRVTDLAVLVRDLFEHVVHLAWLGAGPGRERVEAWRKHDLSERLKADRDASDHGVLMLTAEEMAEMERTRSSTAASARSRTRAGVGFTASSSIPAQTGVGWRWSKRTVPTRSIRSGSGQ